MAGVIDETIAAYNAGAEFVMVLVLVPSYFHFAMDSTTIISFFNKVAHHTPLPVMAYNYPGVTAEIALNAGILVALSEHPNTVGAKLTCGGIGKVPRVTAAGATDQFVVLSGQIDWMGPAMSVGAVGGITGLANLRPRVGGLSLFCFWWSY